MKPSRKKRKIERARAARRRRERVLRPSPGLLLEELVPALARRIGPLLLGEAGPALVAGALAASAAGALVAQAAQAAGEVAPPRFLPRVEAPADLRAFVRSLRLR